MAIQALARQEISQESIEQYKRASPRWRRTRAVMLLGDLTAIIGAGLLAALSWSTINPSVNVFMFLRLWPLTLVIPFGFMLGGLYPAAGVSPVDELRRLSIIITGVYGSAMGGLFLVGMVQGQSRGTFVLAWLLTLLFVPVNRTLLVALFARSSWWGVPAVLLGAGRTSELILERLEDNPSLSIKVLGCFDDDPTKVGTTVNGVPVLGTLADAGGIGRSMGIRRAIVAMPGLEPKSLAALANRYAAVFPYLVFVPNMFGVATIGVSARDLAGVMGLHVRQNLLMPTSRLVKRGIDLLLLVPAGILALPVIAIAAIGVIIVSPGNPFYSQKREGQGGKTIRVWKLRSMRKNADELLRTYLDANPVALKEWETHYKLTHDPRILPLVGSIIRRTSIDELPQLWNILSGEMSFVGPRPFPYYHVEQFSPEFRTLRASVVTGAYRPMAGHCEVYRRPCRAGGTRHALHTQLVSVVGRVPDSPNAGCRHQRQGSMLILIYAVRGTFQQ